MYNLTNAKKVLLYMTFKEGEIYMLKLKNYKCLLNNNKYLKLFVKPFKLEEIQEKLDIIFNSHDSKVDWSNIPVHIVVK